MTLATSWNKKPIKHCTVKGALRDLFLFTQLYGLYRL